MLSNTRQLVHSLAVVVLVLGFLGQAVTAAKSAGCGKAAGIASGTYSVTVNGKSRQYIIRVPNGYDSSRGYKLIFGLHWLSGTMTDVATGQTVQRDVWDWYGLRRLANEGAIFIAPQGLNNGWANQGGEDITFIDTLVQTAQDKLCVDTTQIFATGFSYGGAMSYSLACSRPNVFRAVAVLSGGLLSGCSGGTGPIAYLGIHGLRDNVLSISGGRQLRDKFVSNNGCTPQSPREPSQGSYTHVSTTYSGCRAGYPVRWVAFDEGHIAAPRDGGPGDSGTQAFSPGETWNFFNQFASGEQPGTTNPPTTPTSTTSSPQPTGNCAALYGQCGGQGWQGPTCCSQGTCKASNQWYSQCL
ncbi:Alpha/Beta hydrolase protein [Microdochium trichocladiopsis]|uniref:Feruloyl esterase C n=1 Tax=Microdochium trichocladiopsis TaxID=1682393 RepID=A0A9P8YAE6_9PEZI|nr:Alpha/Beta hydrolase protein [Microdochium trichocladiopsis]KAH7036019.1 Alpha/Beta hydrolase protein [Microdochium trichocladiopsis]